MGKYPKLSNPPITEALLDIRVELPKEATTHNLESIHDIVKVRFPEKEARFEIEASFHVSPKDPKTYQTATPIGFWFKSPNGNKIFQCRLNGFTYNKLKPYNGWEKFSKEAFELWDLYLKHMKPIKITRLALRYINHIEIPLPITDFKYYFQTIPELGPELPQGLVGFLMKLIIPNEDIEATGVITETIGPITPSGKLPFILDIDVSKQAEYEKNVDIILQDMEKLRDYKNDIFFGSVTEATRRLFE